MKKIDIIAEIGANHNGNIKIAKKLIDIASKSGANYAKFQIFDTKSLISKEAKSPPYAKKKNLKNGYYNLQKKLQLRLKDLKILKEFCKVKKIKFLVSVFDNRSISTFKKLSLSEIKIPSSELSNFLLIQEIAKLKLNKLFISTGMCTMKDVKKLLSFVKKKGIQNNKIVLLHCNTEYPTPFSDVNLNVINSYKKIFKGHVGLSDHSKGIYVPIAAVAMGATTIEKHITLSKKMKGPDHSSSLEPNEFYEMCKGIAIVNESMGSSQKKITKSEKKNIKYIIKKIVAKKNIKKNELFTKNNLTLKRNHLGLEASNIFKILNKKSKFNFREGDIIKI
jgi:N,N'-diacetyllegionaminate synthase